jgi:hypothetical protein
VINAGDNSPNEHMSVYTASFHTVLSGVRQLVEENNYKVSRVILKVGPLRSDKYPKFFQDPRVIYPDMSLIEDLFDDNEFAVALLSCQ